MTETKHFINLGYGWMCKSCLEETNASALNSSALARFFTEGEAEEREIPLSAPSLARWRNESHETLFCPRCGTEETMNDEG